MSQQNRSFYLSIGACIIALAALITALSHKCEQISPTKPAVEKPQVIHHSDHKDCVTREELNALLEAQATSTAPGAESPKPSTVSKLETTRRLLHEPVDLSEYPTTKGQLNAILLELEDVNGYSIPHPILTQLEELPLEATSMMLEQLKKTGRLSTAQKGMMVEALRKRLTPEDSDEVFKVFMATGEFSSYLASAGYEGMQEPLFAALHTGTMPYTNGMKGFHQEFIEAAITLNPDRAETVLLERIQLGDMNAAISITTIPDADASAAVELAVQHANSSQQKAQILPYALEYGIDGSLDIAIEALENTSDSHWSEKISRAVRQYTGAIGGVQDVATWLRENKDHLEYDANEKVYRLK